MLTSGVNYGLSINKTRKCYYVVTNYNYMCGGRSAKSVLLELQAAFRLQGDDGHYGRLSVETTSGSFSCAVKQ